ncbi:hypothetical protein K493DRAFT_203292, partial [Basidiobolus meristosporus CBS 931.73]
FTEHGREDGLRAGKEAGIVEGRVLGCFNGYAIAQEVGYYKGCTTMWLKLAEAYPNLNLKKALRQLNSLLSMVESFPLENVLELELIELLEKIRGKFKVVTTVLGCSQFQKFNPEEKSKLSY